MKKIQIPSSNEIVKTIDCCERWLNYEEKKLNLSWAINMEKDLPCPCSVKEVLSNNDNNKNKIIWTPEHSTIREYSYFFKLERCHPGAKKCYRAPYKNIHGQQCCYGDDNLLIIDGPGGGTADKGLATLNFFNLFYSFILSPIYTPIHKQLDVFPFLDCGGSSAWRIYQKYRPISSGYDHCGRKNEKKKSIITLNNHNKLLFPNSLKVKNEQFCNWQPSSKHKQEDKEESSNTFL